MRLKDGPCGQAGGGSGWEQSPFVIRYPKTIFSVKMDANFDKQK